MSPNYKSKETVALRQVIENVKVVKHLLASVQVELISRQLNHDNSKLENPEWNRVLYKYDKEEFPMSEEDLEIAKHHHYAHNRHHPERFKNGLNDMHIVDIIELIIDWIGDAYTDNEDVEQAIKRKAEKYNIDPQLLSIFLNTADWINKNPIIL